VREKELNSLSILNDAGLILVTRPTNARTHLNFFHLSLPPAPAPTALEPNAPHILLLYDGEDLKVLVVCTVDSSRADGGKSRGGDVGGSSKSCLMKVVSRVVEDHVRVERRSGGWESEEREKKGGSR